MSPETIRSVAHIRQEFYRQFAELIAVPVNINQEKNYGSTLSKVSWLDEQNHSNYVCIYAHIAPDTLFPDRPLILRLAVNNGMEYMSTHQASRVQTRIAKKVRVNVTLLPEEVLDFLPWVASLFTASASDSRYDEQVTLPPYPLSVEGAGGLCQQVWTSKALMRFSQHLRHCEALSR